MLGRAVRRGGVHTVHGEAGPPRVKVGGGWAPPPADNPQKPGVVALILLQDELAGDPVYQVRFRRYSQAAARVA